ncbi:hypothetical protein BDV12DRAFT_185133 [Aspergillus spectabilis]
MSFPYKHILLIGATSGIGLALASRLLESGMEVTAVGRRKERLESLVSNYGAERAQSVVFDITQSDKIVAFAKDVTETNPDIDSIFLNAGVQRVYDLASDEQWDLAKFNEEVQVNLLSIVALVHAFSPFLIARAKEGPARSNLSIIPAAWAPGYCGTKTALNVFVMSLREQLKLKSNLKIIEFSPPAVQTELHDDMGPHGAKIGMPLDQFTDEAWKGLQEGKDTIVVGAVEPRELFYDILEKRRKGFEILADMLRQLRANMAPIPITILTGFLGSGKTTLILNLLPQLPKDYKLALLKNEFGDLAIDSQLASTSSISGVRELLNGCICCNLVGQLSDALEELRTGVEPDRIIIETSGSAFPATLAMEVNRISRESPGLYTLDGVVSVIDVENWAGYEDTSYTAKLQARYTDLIVMNKWEGVGERRFDEVLDRVGDLGVETAWVRSARGRVEKGVLLGVDGALVAQEGISLGLEEGGEGEGHEHGYGHEHGHQSEVEVLTVSLKQSDAGAGIIDITALEKLLSTASKEEVYRIKGILRCSTQTPPASSSDDLGVRPSPNSGSESAYYILNWAFGRWTCTPSEVVAESADPAVVARITLILARYESAKWKKRLEAGGLVQSKGVGAELSVERLV